MTEKTDKTARKRELKVAIVGKAPSSRGLAPYSDGDWEIWTLSDLVPRGQAPRFTRHFELHPMRWFKDRGGDYYPWLCSIRDATVYLQEPDENVPAGVPYPKNAIVEAFAPVYFTNTVSWMIALAIHEKATEIGVYGVDMAQDKEYARQRPSCEYLLGWARGAGITVHLPEQSDLLKSRGLYGFDTDNGELERLWWSRQRELQERINRKVTARDQAALEVAALQGALDSQQYYQQWLDGGKIPETNGKADATDRIPA